MKFLGVEDRFVTPMKLCWNSLSSCIRHVYKFIFKFTPIVTARWSGRRYEQLPCFFFSSASGPRYSNMLLILKLFPILFFSSGPARFLNGQRPDNKKVKRQRAWGTPWLKKIIFFFFFFIWVIGVLRRTVVCDWSFDNLCGSHLQSQVRVGYRKTITWHLASAQVVETSVTNNSLSQYSNHPDDLFQSRYVTPEFRPFSYWDIPLRCGSTFSL